MIILSSTNDKIEVSLAGAVTTNQLDCVCSYRDITTTTYTPGRTVTSTNNTTPVSISGSPTVSTQRVVDFISIFNKDTVSVTVKLVMNDGVSTYTIFSTVLLQGEKLEYTDKNGFTVFSASNAIKILDTKQQVPFGNESTAIATADVSDTTTVTTPINGLSFQTIVGATYYFRAIVQYTAAATTTGSRFFAIVSGGAGTNRYLMSNYSLTTTTITNNQGMSSFGQGLANATSATTGSNIAIVEGFFDVTTASTFQIAFASEVVGSAITAKAGSVLYYQRIL